MQGKSHRCQARTVIQQSGNIVETGDLHIRRDLQSGVVQRGCRTKGHDVVDGEQAGPPGGQRKLSHRRFRCGVTTVAVAASPLASTEAQAYDPGNDEAKARYRETDHVKAFYRTNGYETLKK